MVGSRSVAVLMVSVLVVAGLPESVTTALEKDVSVAVLVVVVGGGACFELSDVDCKFSAEVGIDDNPVVTSFPVDC